MRNASNVHAHATQLGLVAYRLILGACAVAFCGVSWHLHAEDLASTEETYRRKVGVALSKFHEELDAIHSDYMAALKKQMDERTKAGDLDNAVAARDKLKNTERFKDATSRTVINDVSGTTWKDARGHGYSFFPDSTCLGDGPGKYNAPCFAVGTNALLVCWYQGDVIGAYDLFVWDKERTEYKRHHFQLEKNTQPASTGQLDSPPKK